ncbi:MAG: Gfo/Idh/MocA family oxidoreductase [Bacteroidota bacterium]|nr:Gfo/Idh/MocA family oxidoreductase [Bacteroidota bacterium]
MKRSDFLKISSLFGGGMLGGLGLGLSSCTADPTGTKKGMNSWSDVTGSMAAQAAPAIPKVRVAMLGLGNRGSSLIEMLEWLVTQGHAEITALCDVQPAYVQRAADKVASFQTTAPLRIDDPLGEEWKQACNPELADLVVIATPWHLHTPMALYAMEQGLHAASEVPIAYTEEDCLALVKASERTQKHCIMLENCCYNGEELWLLNMVKEGVFGDVTHAECAYLHDLRTLLLDATYYHNRWRLREHLERDGNLYTTHGLGPVCMYMDVLRGDNLSHLVSMSSNEAALSKALRESEEPELQALASRVKCGDVNTTLIRTTAGKSIMLQFDTHTGRPYSRLNKLSGTGATHYGYPSRLYLDHGPTWDWHRWQEKEAYDVARAQYDHPLWSSLKEGITSNQQGHGGMDFVMMYRLIRCLNEGVALDLSVYDGALWSLVGVLSERSVAQGNQRMDIPDVSGGTWQTKREHPVFRGV